MRIQITLIIFLLVAGCSTSQVTISTHYPEQKEYDLNFGWLLVKDAQDKSLTQKAREEKYEVIINKTLKGDINTRECSIIKNSFHYFEPGCCAAAKVTCKNPINFEGSEGIYNSNGIPLYFYKLNKE